MKFSRPVTTDMHKSQVASVVLVAFVLLKSNIVLKKYSLLDNDFSTNSGPFRFLSKCNKPLLFF